MKTKLTALLVMIAMMVSAQCTTFTVNHDPVNGIAPYATTITYKAVDGISPYGDDLCWLAQNLGATRQAKSFSSDDVQSAGWYFQFNSPAGAINGQNFGWMYYDEQWSYENDPCRDLGSDWRMPTAVEWGNVKAYNAWNNGKKAYRSPLKLHAAGYAAPGSDMIVMRGTFGFYWSRDPGMYYGYGQNFFIQSGGAAMYMLPMAYGLNVRCVRWMGIM